MHYRPGISMEGSLTREEFFEEEAGKAAGVVAEDAVLLEEVIENNAGAEFLENREIDGHRRGAFRAVAARHFRRDRLAVGDHPINHTGWHVFLNSTDVVR